MSALETQELSVRTQGSSLRSIPQSKSVRVLPTGAFPILILGLLAGGMVGHLLLQTRIQEQGFELAALQTQVDHLSAEEAMWRATLDRQSTPTQLAYAAAQLGMVANPYSNILVLPTGEVLGAQKPVKGNEVSIISAAPILPQLTPAEEMADEAAEAIDEDVEVPEEAASEDETTQEDWVQP